MGYDSRWSKAFFDGPRLSIIFVMMILLVGCDSLLTDGNGQSPVTPVNVRIESVSTENPTINLTATNVPSTPTQAPTPTPLPLDLEDALPVMSGLCFESVFDAAGRVFIMRSAEEHIHLYDLAENSGLCRRPIIRHPFNFDGGRVLAGTWTAGIGCTADHEILDYQRDDANKTILFLLRFVTDGDCPYELVRPFWVALPEARDYEIIINVERAG